MVAWQDSLTSNKDRLSHIYRSGQMSDVTLTVGRDGEEKERFRVHKLILSMQSDVFFTMFYGSLPDEDKVEIIDIKPAIFKIVMKYVYEDSFSVESLDEAMETYVAAEKYNVAHLRNLCASYITEHLSAEDIPTLYEMPNILDELKIKSRCNEILSEETSAVLKSRNFLKSPLALVEDIVALDHLAIHREAVLFHYVLKWANSAINVSEPRGELRALMDRFLPHIRFLAMNAREFVTGPASSGVLTEGERASILENLAVAGSSPLPSWCNECAFRTSFSSSKTLRSSKIFQNHRCTFLIDPSNVIIPGVSNENTLSFGWKITKGTLEFRGISFYVAASGWMEPKASMCFYPNRSNEIPYPLFNESTSLYDPATSLMKCTFSKPFTMNRLNTEYRIYVSLKECAFKYCQSDIWIAQAYVETESFKLIYTTRGVFHLYEIFYN